MAGSGSAPASVTVPWSRGSCRRPRRRGRARPGGGGHRRAPAPGRPHDTLHRVVADAVLLAIVEDRHDVGVVQLRRRPGLGLKSPQVRPVGTEPRVHDLERHAALERLVLGFVDDPHAAAAELAEQGVVAQPLRPICAGGTGTAAARVVR